MFTQRPDGLKIGTVWGGEDFRTYLVAESGMSHSETGPARANEGEGSTMRTNRPLRSGVTAGFAATAVLLGAWMFGATSASADTEATPVPGDVADYAGDFDLQLLMTLASEGPLQVGDTVTYQVSVANLGPAAAPTGWTVAGTIPNGLTSVALQPAADSSAYACVLGVSDFSCTYSGDLAAGATAPLGSVTATVSDVLADVPVVENTACVGNNAGDTNEQNDCATAATALAAASPVAEVAVQGAVIAAPAATQSITSAELAATGSRGAGLLLPGAALVALGLVVMRLGRRPEIEPN